MRVSPDQFEAIAGALPMGRDPASVRRRLEAMEAVLERLIVIPGTRQTLGLDAMLGLIPIVGDLISAALGSWLIWEARNLGMSRFQLVRMSTHVGIDTLLGAIPLVGDAFDFFYRSNTKNLRIIKKHLDKHYPGTVTIDG